MILNFYWPLDGSGDELKGFGVGKQLLFHRASPLPRRPPFPWAPLAMTFSLSQWVGGGVDGNEQRERPRRGWGEVWMRVKEFLRLLLAQGALSCLS